MTAKKLDCTFERYHQDPCDVPSLSASMAHRVVSESLLHAWTFHPRLGGLREESTEEQVKGTILHRLLLGRGQDYEVLDVDEYRSNADKALRDRALARGKTPIKRKHFLEFEKAADKIRMSLHKLGFDFDGESEFAMTWEEPINDSKVVCRAMMDHVFLEDGLIYDVKKVRSANPKAIARTFVQYGYDIQQEAYRRALTALTDHRQVEFVFLFCEIEPPYAVLPVPTASLSGAMKQIGFMRWEEALASWSKALITDKWSSYSDRPLELIEPAPWDAAQYLGNWKE